MRTYSSLDSHNASWTAKQRTQNPATKITAETNQHWFERYATHGLVVCIMVQEVSGIHLELDSIDRVMPEKARLHTNKYGWFSFAGQLEETTVDAYTQRRLCRPDKTLITAACCGHQWSHKGRVAPRPLSLREILLASTLNWKHFRTPHRQNTRPD